MAKRLPGPKASWTLLAVGLFAILVFCPHLPNDPYWLERRFLVWGLPAAAIVLGASGLEGSMGARIPRWLISQGDASYAIYLVQTFVLPVVGVAATTLALNGIPALAFCIAAGLSLSAIAGEVAHRFIEKPILAFLKNNQQKGAGVAA